MSHESPHAGEENPNQAEFDTIQAEIDALRTEIGDSFHIEEETAFSPRAEEDLDGQIEEILSSHGNARGNTQEGEEFHIVEPGGPSEETGAMEEVVKMSLQELSDEEKEILTDAPEATHEGIREKGRKFRLGALAALGLTLFSVATPKEAKADGDDFLRAVINAGGSMAVEGIFGNPQERQLRRNAEAQLRQQEMYYNRSVRQIRAQMNFEEQKIQIAENYKAQSEQMSDQYQRRW